MSDPKPGTLDFAARLNPQGEALIQGDIRRTWEEWDERACRLGSFLREKFGIGPGDRVTWMMHNTIECFDLLFALQKIGALGVPIGYRLTGPEAAYIVDNSDAKAVVCQGRFAERLESALDEMPRISADRFLVVGSANERGGALGEALPFEDAIATGSSEQFIGDGVAASGSMVYTSGTTGRPKGAYREGDPSQQDALREFLIGVVQGFGFTPPDKHLVLCPLYHSAPPVFASISHLFGGTVVIAEKFDAEQTLRTIQDEQITSAFVVPTQLNRITSLSEEVASRYDLGSMKRLLVGAAPFPFPLKKKTVEFFPSPCVYEFYGSTETAINTLIGPEDQLRKPGSCGKILPGNEIRIVDDEGKDVPTGEVGTLYAKNPFLISGYHKNKQATDDCLMEGFFSVGDMARVDEEGFYYIVDRKKDMIISGGVNIYPAEIEAELRKHPAVFDCAVIGVPNEEWGEEVKAVVQLREGESISAEEISEFLAESLADYKRPRSIDFVDDLPYNPSGKILKREIRKPYWEAAGRDI